MIEAILFWGLAAASAASALCVVVLRNPVNSVMALLAAMLATAGLYALMGAYVVALFQVNVYIGAVLVLFLFVVMLLNLKGPAPDMPRNPAAVATSAAAVGLTAGMAWLGWRAVNLSIPAGPNSGLRPTSWTDFEVKGDNPLTEHYSAIGPEVLDGPDGRPVGWKNKRFLEKLDQFDRVIIAGQAKSHCVAWTIDDLLTDIQEQNPELVKKVYLLNDCSSAVVVPGVADYTEEAEAAFRKFSEAGMHIIESGDPIDSWPE